MMSRVQLGAVLVALCLARGAAFAGWEIEQVHYSLRPNGTEVGRWRNTVRVSENHVRVNSNGMTILVDYEADRLALLLPERRLYWRGSTRQYVDEVAATVRRRRFAPTPDEPPPAPVTIKVQAAGVKEKVAGHLAAKYVITVDGKIFQELWVAPDITVGADLDLRRFHDFQQRVSRGVRGGAARAFAALNRTPAYLKLYERGFPVKTQSYLGQAVLGREVVRISPAVVQASEFAVPPDYSRTSLANLLDAGDDIGQ